MSGDALCVGVCMIDWDSGVCLGCGRTAEEINGVPTPAPGAQVAGQPDAAASQAQAAGVPLPPNVAARVGEGSD